MDKCNIIYNTSYVFSGIKDTSRYCHNETNSYYKYEIDNKTCIMPVCNQCLNLIPKYNAILVSKEEYIKWRKTLILR